MYRRHIGRVVVLQKVVEKCFHVVYLCSNQVPGPREHPSYDHERPTRSGGARDQAGGQLRKHSIEKLNLKKMYKS